MTCIAGLVAEDGRVVIGGDSAGVAGWDIVQRSDPKVFRRGPFLYGFCGSFRMGQLLRHAFRPPRQGPRQRVEHYMSIDYVDAVRECFTKGGFARKEQDQEFGGQFLVGYRGRLWHVGEDYQVGETIYGFNAVGAGDTIAMGSLYTSQEWPIPEARVRAALEAAEQFNGAVRGPFVIESLRPWTPEPAPAVQEEVA